MIQQVQYLTKISSQNTKASLTEEQRKQPKENVDRVCRQKHFVRTHWVHSRATTYNTGPIKLTTGLLYDVINFKKPNSL